MILERASDDVTILIYILDILSVPNGRRTSEQPDHWKTDTFIGAITSLYGC